MYVYIVNDNKYLIKLNANRLGGGKEQHLLFRLVPLILC